MVAAAFPVGVRGASRHLVLLHDLSFAARRSAEARGLVLLALGGVAFGAALLAGLVSLLAVRSWLRSLRRAIDDVQTGRREAVEISDRTVIGRYDLVEALALGVVLVAALGVVGCRLLVVSLPIQPRREVVGFGFRGDLLGPLLDLLVRSGPPSTHSSIATRELLTPHFSANSTSSRPASAS